MTTVIRFAWVQRCYEHTSNLILTASDSCMPMQIQSKPRRNRSGQRPNWAPMGTSSMASRTSATKSGIFRAGRNYAARNCLSTCIPVVRRSTRGVTIMATQTQAANWIGIETTGHPICSGLLDSYLVILRREIVVPCSTAPIAALGSNRNHAPMAVDLEYGRIPSPAQH
jgi:hypothetical protein